MIDRRAFMAGVSALLIAPAGRTVSSAIRRGLWPEGRAGAVSLTYDDGLDSQLDLALPALDRSGLKATFFVTMANIRHRQAEWEKIVSSGHELANHTLTHPCDLQRFTPADYRRRELLPVERWLNRIQPNRSVRSFAYPCDVTNLGSGDANRQEAHFDRLLAGLGIDAARTSEGEPNRPATALRRPHRLQALAVGYDAPDLATVDVYLRQAVDRGHWAILVFHDITPLPRQFGQTSERLHAQILDLVAGSSLWCAPLGQVFDRIRHRA